MSFDWAEYYKQAEDLATRNSSDVSREADLRSAISRAYYASFCKGRNLLRDKDGETIPLDGSAHRVVKTKFTSSSDLVRKKIGQNLDRLRIDRNIADYHDTIPNIEDLALADLLMAEEVIAKLNAL